MEVEVDILEPQEAWEKELATQAAIRAIRVPVQTMVINGEEKVVMGKSLALVCPKCGTVIQQFQAGISEIEVYKSLTTEDESLLNQTIYCAGCGQKLKLMRELPIENNLE